MENSEKLKTKPQLKNHEDEIVTLLCNTKNHSGQNQKYRRGKAQENIRSSSQEL